MTYLWVYFILFTLSNYIYVTLILNIVYDDSLINAYKTSKSDYFSQISILEKNIIKIMSLLDKRSLLMVVSDFGNQEIEYD